MVNMNEATHTMATHTMNVEKKTIRSDIPGHHTFLNGSMGFVASPSEDTRRMVIGRGISLSGAVKACDLLVVEGTMQADGLHVRRLEIPQGGLLSGLAEAQDAVIAGAFEGKLTVPGRLTVKPTARISGEIEYGTLEVEGGGRIEGRLSAIAAAAAEAPAKAVKQLPEPARDLGAAGNVEKLFDETDGTPASRPRVYRRAG